MSFLSVHVSWANRRVKTKLFFLRFLLIFLLSLDFLEGFYSLMAGEGSVDWRKLFAAGIDQELDFFPPSVVEGSCVVKSSRVVFEEGILEWRFSLVGQFVGQAPNFTFLQKAVNLMWGKDSPVKKGLNYIASAIGRPLHMDLITASRERLEYARVCIEISARTQIPDFIDVILYDESLARIRVFVPWLPSSCVDCGRFGHVVKFCPQECGLPIGYCWKQPGCSHGTSVVSSGTSLKPAGPTDSDNQTIIAGNNSVVHTASSGNSGIVLKSVVPTDSADNLVVATDSNLSNVIGTNSVTVMVANGVHSKSSDVAIVGSDVVADLGSKLSEAEHVYIPPVKRGRGRPAKDGKFVGGGSKNKFDVLNSIDPENLMNVPSGNSGKKQKGTALGVSAIIQELKSKKKEHADKFVDWGFCCNYSYSDNGRIWVLWQNHLSCSISSIFDQSITIKSTFGDKVFFLTAVYGSNDSFSRRQLWNQRSTMASVVGSDAWLIGGDFNVILNMEESSNAVNSATVSDISDFQRCVEELGIFDHHWFVAFPSSVVEFHAPGDSDHYPALVWFHKDAPIDKPKPFKFFNFWTTHPDFISIVKNSWQSLTTGNPAHALFLKLKILKRCLKELNMSHFHDISGQVQRKRDELQNIQLSNLCAALAGSFIKDELEAGRELNSLEQAELLFYKQKAKVDWIRDGDQGTRLFYSIVANKRTCNTIRALYNQDGVKLDSFEGMSNEVIRFFKDQLGVTDPDVQSYNINIIRSLLDYSLPRGAADILIKDVSDAEIKDAIWGQGNNKSPGPMALIITSLRLLGL
ncbi:uncharacterized protein LOC120212383 [Hibiscus syriacus]|uniref:uncharacterized protein LOC120212383 n=1 Tax=Hibiscus syriacus TaxID=106335 RepID=UPI0019207191|nr:uncharacterized protein LOC120212383 [Hibiscus syriacus]